MWLFQKYQNLWPIFDNSFNKESLSNHENKWQKSSEVCSNLNRYRVIYWAIVFPKAAPKDGALWKSHTFKQNSLSDTKSVYGCIGAWYIFQAMIFVWYISIISMIIELKNGIFWTETLESNIFHILFEFLSILKNYLKIFYFIYFSWIFYEKIFFCKILNWF
jgi:hypothetical protein